MSTVLGIAGASRNATIALCDDGEVVAVCEQERLTRTRREGLRRGKLPLEATQTVLNLGRRTTADVSQYAVAETAVELPGDLPVARLDHHYGHAAAAFLTSRFSDAVVVVCDRHGESELTVWRADASGITRADFPWIGPGFATLARPSSSNENPLPAPPSRPA